MGRGLALTLALVLLARVNYSCASSAGGSPSQSTSTSQQAPVLASRLISAEELARALEKKDFVLVDVQIPYPGEIDGTDLYIPYDRIGADLAKLPQDKNARVVLYCQSGVQSAIAAKTLVDAGYTNVLDLKGGMAAWKRAGYQVVETSR